MSLELHRHDISNNGWEKIKPHTIGEKGTRGGNAKNTRQFINGVFWILHTGAPWRDLPAEYGHWKNVHRRFCRWRDKGIWENIPAALIDDADFEWLILLFLRFCAKHQHFFALVAHMHSTIVAKLPLARAQFRLLSIRLRSRLVVRGHSRG